MQKQVLSPTPEPVCLNTKRDGISRKDTTGKLKKPVISPVPLFKTVYIAGL